MKNTQSLLLLPEFKKFIRATVNGKRTLPSGKKIRKSTIRQYEFVYKVIEEFESHLNEAIRVTIINKAPLKVIKKEKTYWNHIFNKLLLFMYNDKKYFDVYTLSVCKLLKTFFRYLSVEKGWPIGDFYKKLRVPSKQFTPVVLSPVQLKKLIMDTEFENKLKPQLKRVKDIFVFGSTVGLRFSDLMSLKNNSIQYTGEGVFLSINTQKTGAEVRIPLPQYAVDIIEKYKKRGGNYVLPRLAGSNLNIQLKNLMKVAGWVYTLPKFRTRRGVLIEIKTRKGESYRFFFRPESPATRPRIWQGFLAATKNFATISAQTISLQSSN